jgi:hypothetical protein
MDLIALLELDEPANMRLLTADKQPAVPKAPVVRVHAAAHSTQTPAQLTLCGLPTRGMQPDSQYPATPGEPWWPPRWHRHTCPVCDTNVTKSVPPTGSASRQSRRDAGRGLRLRPGSTQQSADPGGTAVQRQDAAEGTPS